MKGFFGDVHLF